MAHMLTVTAGGTAQDYEVASETDETIDLVRTLFANCEKGEVVEVPVRIGGSEKAGYLIVNTANIASALIWNKEDVTHP